MATREITTARTVGPIRRGIWTNTILVLCCQPRMPPLLSHNCIATRSNQIGSRKRYGYVFFWFFLGFGISFSRANLRQDWMSDTEAHKVMRSSIELPPLNRRHNMDPTSDPYSPLNAHRARDHHLASLLSTSPPGRSSTLPPIQRHTPSRPRKQSVSKRAREPQHKRQKSKDQLQMRRMSYDRKAYSAEPSSNMAAYGKRWEDLIDAATSATEDVNEDRTPVSSPFYHASPWPPPPS
jgi:hypothetical protein